MAIKNYLKLIPSDLSQENENSRLSGVKTIFDIFKILNFFQNYEFFRIFNFELDRIIPKSNLPSLIKLINDNN